MWLSSGTLRRLIDPFDETQTSLIDPVEPARFKFIEGCSYDLTLEAIKRKQNFGGRRAILGKKVRDTPDLREVIPWTKQSCFMHLMHLTEEERNDLSDELYCLEFGLYQLLFTEHIEVPLGLVGIVFSRVSWGLSGALTFGTKIAPGFSGQIKTPLFVADPDGVIIERETLGVTVGFIQVDSELVRDCDPYGGNGGGFWQGDRMSSGGVIAGS